MGIFVGKPPWYVAGLAFECTQCGRCCMGPEEGYVWVTPDDIEAIAAHLRIDAAEMRRRYVRRVGGRYSLIEVAGSRDCVFLDADPAGDGRRICRIYPVRPVQCRTWPFWASNLSDPDCWTAAQRRCAGINRGKLHSAEEIDAKRRATRE